MIKLKVFNYRFRIEYGMIEIINEKRDIFKMFSIAWLMRRFFYGEHCELTVSVPDGRVEFVTMHNRYFRVEESIKKTWWSKWPFLKSRRVGWTVYLEQESAPIFENVMWAVADTPTEAVLHVVQLNNMILRLRKYSRDLEDDYDDGTGAIVMGSVYDSLTTMVLKTDISYTVNKRNQSK